MKIKILLIALLLMANQASQAMTRTNIIKATPAIIGTLIGLYKYRKACAIANAQIKKNHEANIRELNGLKQGEPLPTEYVCPRMRLEAYNEEEYQTSGCIAAWCGAAGLILSTLLKIAENYILADLV